MNVWGSGYIVQLIYSSTAIPSIDPYAIFTEDNQYLLTEDMQNIDIEHS